MGLRLQFVDPAACVVAGCKNEPVAEVPASKRGKAGTRRWGTPRISVCLEHEPNPEVNVRLGRPMWQGLLFV